MNQIAELLEETENSLDKPTLSVETLDSIGKMRFCCDLLSDYLQAKFIEKKKLHESIDRIFEMTKKLCLHENAANLR